MKFFGSRKPQPQPRPESRPVEKRESGPVRRQVKETRDEWTEVMGKPAKYDSYKLFALLPDYWIDEDSGNPTHKDPILILNMDGILKNSVVGGI